MYTFYGSLCLFLLESFTFLIFQPARVCRLVSVVSVLRTFDISLVPSFGPSILPALVSPLTRMDL